MQGDAVKAAMREKVVEKSIEILRSHGKSESEIKEMMLKDFSIGENTLDKLMKSSQSL